MSVQDLFTGLINTYRELNLKVRSLPEERVRLGREGDTVRDVIIELRDDELRFTQALKDRLTGAPMVDIFKEEDAAMLEIPSPDDTTAEVISQFGIARESPRAMLQGMPPEAWEDPSLGAPTIREATDKLLRNDAVHLERIVRLLGSPSPN
jgi:hypothetical protein